MRDAKNHFPGKDGKKAVAILSQLQENDVVFDRQRKSGCKNLELGIIVSRLKRLERTEEIV